LLLGRALYSNEIARFRGLGLVLISDTFCSSGIACFRGLALIFDSLCLPEIACLWGLGGDLVVTA